MGRNIIDGANGAVQDAIVRKEPDFIAEMGKIESRFDSIMI
jgi:hypothetical protein